MALKNISIAVSSGRLKDVLMKSGINLSKEPLLDIVEVKEIDIVYGEDPRSAKAPSPQAPNVRFLRLEHDFLNQPRINIYWDVPKKDLINQKIKGFNVYKRKVSPDTDEMPEAFRNGEFATLSRLFSRQMTLGRSDASTGVPTLLSRQSVPATYTNRNVALETGRALSSTTRQEDSPVDMDAIIADFIKNNKFQHLAYVDYGQFLKDLQNYKVVVVDKKQVDMFFKDSQVLYNEKYQYCISTVLEGGIEGKLSEVVDIYVNDFSGAPMPENLRIYQKGINALSLKFNISNRDRIRKALVYRKSERDFAFSKVGEFEPTTEVCEFEDANVEPRLSYDYRVFLLNIFDSISFPAEIKYHSSVAEIVGIAKSNDLKIPLFRATQDQNSDFIKVNIFPNDKKIFYYKLERRNLTIGHTKFSYPSIDTDGYGGTNGWPTNQFINHGEQISFVDNVVYPDNIYEYKLSGYDLAGNPSSPVFATIRATKKKTLRSPINLATSVVSYDSKKLRLAITWSDDNKKEIQKILDQLNQQKVDLLNQRNALQQQQLLDLSELLKDPKFDNKNLKDFYKKYELTKEQIDIISQLELISSEMELSYLRYKVQRRKEGSFSYEEFPLTKELQIIDETSSSKEEAREFGVPKFLEENSVYYYRVAVYDPLRKEESNFSDEVKVFAVRPVSPVVRLRTALLNKKALPSVIRLDWEIDAKLLYPDHWVIERKVDSSYDTFYVVGKAYAKQSFYDKDTEHGKKYVYRVKAVDSLERNSSYSEIRILNK